jgi:hypothetical protein
MRFGVNMAFITVRSLGLLEPVFCVKVLSLYIILVFTKVYKFGMYIP